MPELKNTTTADLINATTAALKEEDPSVTKASVQRAVAEFLNQAVCAASKPGSTVILNGLGRLRNSEVPERMGRNPRTGEKMVQEARNKVTFKVVAALRKIID